MPIAIPERRRYPFAQMPKSDTPIRVHITDADPQAGERARLAAYAVARRSNGKKRFVSQTQKLRGKKYLLIWRVK